MNQTQALVALNSLRGVGPVCIRKLTDTLGCLSRIFDASTPKALKAAKFSDSVIKSIKGLSYEWIDEEYAAAHKHGVRILTIFDSDYPEVLKAIPQTPPVLYIKGTGPLSSSRAVAIVGSRRASIYGTNMAETIARDLALAQVTVVSGLARGIDAAAHRGALLGKGRTLAVLGSGLNHIYPREHCTLADKISESGALLSEFSMNHPPLPRNFPRRNRIISALAEGVLLIEAAKRSGSLITARYAFDQGRKVYALPGKADSVTSKGTHQLLKEGALFADAARDILRDLNWDGSLKVSRARASPQDSLSDPMDHQLYSLIHDDAVSVDELKNRTGWKIFEISSRLTKMELMGKIRQLPGNKFIRRI